MIPTQTLLDANALVSSLHYGGMRGVIELIESDEDAYEDPAVYLVAISLLKNMVDGLLPLLNEFGLDISWSDLLSKNAEVYTSTRLPSAE